MLTDSGLISELIGGYDNFIEFMMLEDNIEHLEANKRVKNDAWALHVIQSTFHITSGTQLQKLDKMERNQALAQLKAKGISVRQLERLTGINRGIIQKAKIMQGYSSP